MKHTQVLTDEEAIEIAAFAGITPEKVRGVEVLVLMKAAQLEAAELAPT